MDSDLPPLEISNEDDSLLQQIPNDAVQSTKLDNNNNNNEFLFSCSPLLIHNNSNKSLDSVTGNGQTEKTSSSSQMENFGKENSSANKAELPNLSMEPQQMKRKKNNKSSNLRKSLAWDRAFFMEEGVLNSVELSMITGCRDNLTGGMSVIHEEDSESISGASLSFETPKRNTSKELPASALKHDKKIGAGSLPKINASSSNKVIRKTMAKQNMTPVHDVNKSGSNRGGCPRPLPFSSIKRPASMNIAKASIRNPKVSRVPVTKSDRSSMTSKHVTPAESWLKHNQITQPSKLLKNAGPKGSSVNGQGVQKSVTDGSDKMPLPVKCSIQEARKNLASSLLEAQTSSDLFPGFAATSHSNNHADRSSKAATLTGNPCNASGSMQYAKFQTEKPSGLRKPSPSLGFFNQPKISDLQGKLSRVLQARDIPKSSISHVGKVAASGSMVPATIIPGSSGKGRSSQEVYDVHKKSVESTQNHNSGMSSHVEDMKFHLDDKRTVSQYERHEHLMEENDSKKRYFGPKNTFRSGGQLENSTPQHKDDSDMDDRTEYKNVEVKLNPDKSPDVDGVNKQHVVEDEACDQTSSDVAGVDGVALEQNDSREPKSRSSAACPMTPKVEVYGIEAAGNKKCIPKDDDPASYDNLDSVDESVDCMQFGHGGDQSPEKSSSTESLTFMVNVDELGGALISPISNAVQVSGLKTEGEVNCFLKEDGSASFINSETVIDSVDLTRCEPNIKFPGHPISTELSSSLTVTDKEVSGSASTWNLENSDGCPNVEHSCHSVLEQNDELTDRVVVKESGGSETRATNSSWDSEESHFEDKSTANKNPDSKPALVIKPPPNAVPFSDEWLAALEAAGEDILTMKSGAVQNSPPNKSVPEPGPWSPVRRKNNQGIGPYDCTKYTSSNIPDPDSH